MEICGRTPQDLKVILKESVLTKDLNAVSNAFTEKGIRHLFFKGTALAHSLYDSPEQRPRCDTDVLIQEHDRESAENILLSLGFEPSGEVSDLVFNYQRSFVKSSGYFYEAIDLHWRISNRPIFANLITFEEAWASSLACPRLGTSARIFGNVHALLISIVHPFMHHHGEHDPIWERDQKLLARSLSLENWKNFWQLSRQKGVRRLVATRIAAPVEEESSRLPFEISWLYVVANNSVGAQKCLDILTSGSYRGSWLIFQESFFPHPRYMFTKYSVRREWIGWLLLPWLYLRRIARR